MNLDSNLPVGRPWKIHAMAWHFLGHTTEQLALLRTEGCTEVQGYLFSPPRPAADGEHGPDRSALPTRQSLGFAAAPVPVDYAPPQAPDFTVQSRAAGLVLSADAVPNAQKIAY